jgi:ParB family chromosome partitioning protein
MKTVNDTCIPSSDYRDLPVAQLVESPTNPRKRYDEAGLQELAESIRAQGVLAPLLVREVASERYEIIAGSRRFRAAKLAGAETVPVRVVPLDDAEAILAQVVENLQRENVHPLEEANGFRALLDLPDQPFNVAAIAAKTGKSPQYVAQRLKLTELIPPAADAFLGDKLTIGHALLIAKLPLAQQAEALEAAFQTTWMSGSQGAVLIPVRELAGWIESHLLLDLHAAPFDRADAALAPEAGSCHDCAKRTGANSLLFPETDRDQCLDRSCYQAKVNAHIAAALECDTELVRISNGWGSHDKSVLGRDRYVEIVAKPLRSGHGKASPERKKCEHMTKGIVVEGGPCGHIVDICTEPSCEIHHAEARKEREAMEKMRAEQRKQDERREQEMATRSRVLSAILAKVSAPLSKADLEMVAREFINRLPNEYRAVLNQRHLPAATNGKPTKPSSDDGTAFKNLDEAGFSRLLIEIALLDAAHSTYTREGAERLEAVAKRYRVHVAKIGESVAAEFAARRKKREERRKAAEAKRNGSGRKAATPIRA